MNLEKGTTLQEGKYVIEKKLGQGGFGITYLGEQVALKRKVAIKEFFMHDFCERGEETTFVTMGSQNSRDTVESFRRKFKKEAENIAKLSHPGIVNIYDVFDENNTVYYVMEYMPGGSLADVINRQGALDERTAVQYIQQVAEALDYMHNCPDPNDAHHLNRMLHLDVKPSNIMLNVTGRAVLVDFGMSKHYDENGGQTSSTPLGISEGYAPLEQYEAGGMENFSPASDIYSLGATLYHLLSGQRPYSASQVVNKGVPVLPEQITSTTRNAVTRSMAFRQTERPQSITEFLQLMDLTIPGSIAFIDTMTGIQPKKTIGHSDNGLSKPAGDKFTRKAMYLSLGLMGVLVIFLCVYLIPSSVPKLDEDTLTYTDTTSFTLDTINNSSKQTSQDSLIEPTVNLIPSYEVEKATLTTTLYVSTSPSGATVYLDDKKIGKSPLEGKEIAHGKHTVKIVLDGYETYTKKYNFENKPIVINENLAIPIRVHAMNEPTEPSKIATTGTIKGHKYVDLGLSVKWADCNVGANVSTERGNYIKWKSAILKKNNAWGGTGRLPTKTEFTELLTECKWTWNPQGYYKVSGPNGNSIYFPAAGFRNGKLLSDVNEGGYYWCSSSYEVNPQDAYFLYFYSGDRSVTWGNIDVERSVRLVSE